MAKQLNIPVVITHVHSTILSSPNIYSQLNWKGRILYFLTGTFINTFWQRYNRRFNAGRITHRWACGQKSGEVHYGDKPFTVIKNSIETDNFCFSENVRTEFRKRYAIADSTRVLGMAAAFIPLKNHAFLLDVFATFHAKEQDSLLVLAGVGPEEQNLRDKIKQLHLEQSVIFAGLVKDMRAFYCGIDYFVFTSPREGLPMVAIEAQCAGLPLMYVDTVTHEIDLLPSTHYLPLSIGAEGWADAILTTPMPSIKQRLDAHVLIKKAGYDINDAVRTLEAQYIALFDNETGMNSIE